MLSSLFRKKAVGVHHESSLIRSLTTLDLTLMGIGAIIGAGVFVLTGIAAATKAGPAVVLSYVVAGVACLFAALAYAELAASIGGTGSAYSYAYHGFGEFVAWVIGWNLILEYFMAVSAVAIGWSGYVHNLFQAIGIHLPYALIKNPFEGGGINLLAVIVIISLCALLCFGVKISSRFNAVVVVIKLITIGIFISIALFNVEPANWSNFMPFGWKGVMHGAALVFFAYIGFDALSTAVEEAVNPQKGIPLSILSSLFICTLIYIIVSALLTGIVPYTTLDVESPVAQALLNIGYRSGAGIIAAGAIAGLTTVILVMFYGLSRIILAIARDGLLPIGIAYIHPTTHTPVRIIVFLGIVMSLFAGFAPIEKAAELVNIGTLAAFVFVCIGVIVFRHTHPDLHRPFRLPYSPIIPLLGVFFCIYLMVHLPAITWWRFVLWTILGIVIYFVYGIRNSVLNRRNVEIEVEKSM